jgi:hypothetical protein
MPWKLTSILVTLGALAACATGPLVKTDADPSADFSKYHSYVWIYQAAPQGMNPLVYERIHTAIDRQLAAQGFTQGQPGDFAVAFTVGKRDKTTISSYGPYSGYFGGFGYRGPYGWGSHYDTYQTTEGSLVIDIYDVGAKKPIWHGLASQNISAPVNQEQINSAVAAVLAKFPPMSAAPAAPAPAPTASGPGPAPTAEPVAS